MMFVAPDLTNKKLRVAAFTYRIVLIDDLRAGSMARWGEHASMTGEISYQQSWPCAAKFIDTLIHEVGHAIWWAYGLEEKDTQERIVATQATAWVQVFQDNPWLLNIIKVYTEQK